MIAPKTAQERGLRAGRVRRPGEGPCFALNQMSNRSLNRFKTSFTASSSSFAIKTRLSTLSHRSEVFACFRWSALPGLVSPHQLFPSLDGKKMRDKRRLKMNPRTPHTGGGGLLANPCDKQLTSPLAPPFLRCKTRRGSKGRSGGRSGVTSLHSTIVLHIVVAS